MRLSEAAVAGDIPDTQALYRTHCGWGLSIKVPEAWARSSDGTATLFKDKYNAIRVETVGMAAAPTVESVIWIDVTVLAAATKGFKPGTVSVLARNAGSAVLALFPQDSLPNAVWKAIRLTVERYECWKAGSVLVVTLSSAAGSDNVDPWKTVTDGLAWAPCRWRSTHTISTRLSRW